MKYGFVIPSGDARTVAELAKTAESHHWDAIFVWEPVWGIDAWVSLTAAAMVTERIKLGTMITPISRMRPWKLASETATLDNLSGGRVILGVGLGAVDTGFHAFGEVTDRKTRAELLDEGLDILTGLWRGQPFSYEGKHYKVAECDFFPPPPPVQQPRIPIWMVGAWHWPKSMARVLRYDGLLPNVLDAEKNHQPLTPKAVAEMAAFIRQEKGNEPFDIVVEGETPGDKPDEAAEKVRPFAQAGATWWLETRWQLPRDEAGLQIVEERIRQGPPFFTPHQKPSPPLRPEARRAVPR
ncbi:MAG: LLM class flavin-dependent oxidoreductase [Ardenticatenaceae bacterium]|nr:LLM class flavin-dependent oxidoreductase [Anaerolineales bacterium]MCB8941096.1 LLM class flavin-dependent oxidoreductase [Ardenticatenaceae bacterium]MCB8972437.1 LLM class flavin-dependent oxidoreductase [Ardenticatenaceae bacterium]